eukprot:TRINITY_DN2258_c0_g1_i1.p1 TRINITY_DN2258_c0_g1~~TRINITY_DN2258_c0_g1_i1.p1  ORF type:complete len:294 (-),score=35.57 TRINITY_DN2258_c0_g1_i1:84-965(-)
MIFSILFLKILKSCRLLHYEPFQLETAGKLYTLAIAFFGMVVTGLAGLRFVNIPMFSALRRWATFFVIAGDYFWLGKVVDRMEFASVVMMISGAMVASVGDLAFDAMGYALTMLNCLVTAWYLILIGSKSKETNLSTFGMMYYNNLMCIPLVLLIVLAIELPQITSYEYYTDTGFLICFSLSSALAFALNYLVFLCSTVNSPLTTSITGQLKSIIQTIAGLFTFGGVSFTIPFIVGLLVSTVGGVWYGDIKYHQTIEQQSKKKISELEKVVVDSARSPKLAHTARREGGNLSP